MEGSGAPETSVKAGSAGGTLLVVLLNLSGEKVLETVVLAGVGAIVSFGVSHGLQKLVKRQKQKV
jgi:hypothetical protein